MHRVRVIGSVNHDRIWRLDAPPVPGGRLRVCDKTVVLGGGGFHTGRAILGLGGRVVLVSRLKRDAFGLSALKALSEIGFKAQHVELLAAETGRRLQGRPITRATARSAGSLGEGRISTVGARLGTIFTLVKLIAKQDHHVRPLATCYGWGITSKRRTLE